MFSYEDLYNKVFDTSIDADRLVIISGYVGPAVVQDLKKLPYNVELYVGMYGNVISGILHKSLLKSDKMDNVSIFYTNILVHAKCYIWFKNEQIVKALIGSANFSTSGLMTPKKEVLGYIPEESFGEMLVYIDLIKQLSYSVRDYSGVERNVVRFTDDLTQTISDKEVEISLLAAKGSGSQTNIIGIATIPGEVHAGAGLNWGFSNAMPKPNDAYIKIPIEQIINNPLMFPPKSSDKINDPIDVIWDDGTEMQMLLEGKQEVDGVDYPKQISTYKSKKELGLYLRKRIGDAIGRDLIIPEELSKEEFVPKANYYKDRFITREMLESYGRTSINIKLIGDRTYYFDFSRNTDNEDQKVNIEGQ